MWRASSDELRPDHPFYQLLPALVREAAPERIELQPLDDEAVGEWLRSVGATPNAVRARELAMLFLAQYGLRHGVDIERQREFVLGLPALDLTAPPAPAGHRPAGGDLGRPVPRPTGHGRGQVAAVPNT